MKKVMKELLSTGAYLLGVLLLTWLIITFVGVRTVVDGDSMEPTLSNNDNLIVEVVDLNYSFF